MQYPFARSASIGDVLKIDLVSENVEMEWWIETEIFPKKESSLNDLLEFIYDSFIEGNREDILSWHFFREKGALRFRIESSNELKRDIVAQKFVIFLDELNIIDRYFFARHGIEITSFNEGYKGEHDQYKRMWHYQKKIWEWGSEMTVESIKELNKMGKNEPPKQYQLYRLFHLLSIQFLPGYEVSFQNVYNQIFFILGFFSCAAIAFMFKALSRRTVK